MSIWILSALLFAVPGTSATLVGTSVSGSLMFAGDPSNYFDPGYGFVPSGNYLNVSGTTVTISDSAVEFGFNDGASLISADFTDNALKVSDLIEVPGARNSFRMTFTDPAFAGQNLSVAAVGLLFADYSLSGDVITIDYAGTSAIPEPATFGAVLLAMVAILAPLRRNVLRIDTSKMTAWARSRS